MSSMMHVCCSKCAPKSVAVTCAFVFRAYRIKSHHRTVSLLESTVRSPVVSTMMPEGKGSTALVVEGDPVMPNSPGFPKPGPEMVRLPTTDIAFLSVACMAKAACNKPSGEEARDTKLVAFTVSTWIPSTPAQLGLDFIIAGYLSAVQPSSIGWICRFIPVILSTERRISTLIIGMVYVYDHTEEMPFADSLDASAFAAALKAVCP